MNRTKIGAALWIACLQYFVAEAVAISQWRGVYSLSRNYISDLGAVGCGFAASNLATATTRLCSPLHAMMNASFLLQGVLIAGGTLLLRTWFPRGGLWSAALPLIGASGLGIFIVGAAPENVAPELHYVGAAEDLLCCNVGMAVMGAAMLRRRQGFARLGPTTLVAGVAGLIGLALLAVRADLNLEAGGIERLAAYPFPLWLATMGIAALRRGAGGNADGAGAGPT